MERKYILKKLEKDVLIRRYSQTTLKRYLYIVETFLDYVDSKKRIEDINENDVIEYLNYLTETRYYKASSFNNVNSILKFFLETTLEKDIGYKRLPNAKVEIRMKVIPTKEEIKLIIDGTNNLKHKLWYSLAYGSGLRSSEIAKLKMSDIDSKNMKIRLIGKGNKERLTVLPKTTLYLLQQYINKEKIKEGYLFKGQKSEHINPRSISRSFKDIVKKLNINKNMSIHSLRRSFATHLLRMGENLEVVKEIMGHNSITTTCGYLEVVYLEKEIKNPLDDN